MERKYYVFPGGGIEKGETHEEAAVREASEELGVIVSVKKHFQTISYQGSQYYYLAEIQAGEIGIGNGEEHTDPERNRGEYIPVWVDIVELPYLDVRPKEVAEKIKGYPVEDDQSIVTNKV